MEFFCPKCSNTNKNSFANKNGEWYCRKCLNFIGNVANKNYQVKNGKYSLSYSLTDNQKEASEFILNNVKKGNSCALNAVCGAGKTEIIYDTIEYCLNNKKKIGIAIPRKDVVIELKERISKDFNVDTIGVYGENHSALEADIIIFTTHQAFRYLNYFDILIIDEVDAFPFKGNEVLQSIVHKCSKVFVYLSATMPKYIEQNELIPKFYLNKRYHGHKIPIPKVRMCFFPLLTLRSLLKKYRDKVVLVYFPTIKIQNKIAKRVKCDYLINSLSENRDKLLKIFKKLKSGVIFTTTVLERGITIKDAQVIVFYAEHDLFDKDTLIQISGRVGRHKEFYKGDIIFICKNKSKGIKRAIRIIKKSNE